MAREWNNPEPRVYSDQREEKGFLQIDPYKFVWLYYVDEINFVEDKHKVRFRAEGDRFSVSGISCFFYKRVTHRCVKKHIVHRKYCE